MRLDNILVSQIIRTRNLSDCLKQTFPNLCWIMTHFLKWQTSATYLNMKKREAGKLIYITLFHFVYFITPLLLLF